MGLEAGARALPVTGAGHLPTVHLNMLAAGCYMGLGGLRFMSCVARHRTPPDSSPNRISNWEWQVQSLGVRQGTSMRVVLCQLSKLRKLLADENESC